MIDQPKPWDLPALDDYVEATMRRMAANRDIRTDARGEPLYAVTSAGRIASGILRMDLEADLSGIGLPTNAPISVLMDPQSGPLLWFMGNARIATTAREATPEQAGDALGMDQLLAAFCKAMGKGFGGKGGR